MITTLRPPTAQHARPQSPESPAKPVAHPSRRAVLKSGLFGFAGLAGTKSASADEGVQSSDTQSRNQRRAPSLDGLQQNQIGMRALENSQLAVSVYPTFTYNASGGAGVAQTQDLGDGRMHVTFDAQTLYIPDVYSKTAKFLGAPLVPPFRIRIEPVKLEGVINKATGEAQLQFIANFMFTASKLYKAPPLYVVTNLTTEGVQGSRRSGQGKRMDPNGFTKLVGVATVPKTHSWPIDKFLMLPDETFAVMVTQFVFPTA